MGLADRSLPTKAYARSINNLRPDANGNVNVNVGDLGGVDGTPSNGQTFIYNTTNNTYEYGSMLGWFIVTDYGAVGDGTTDDTAAINSAIAAINAAGDGVLYFPAGDYRVTSGLTQVTAKCTIRGDGSGDAFGNAASKITCTSATAYCLTIDKSGTVIEDLCLKNTSGSETAGAGIYVTEGEHNIYRNLVIVGFYDNIYLEHGGVWLMSGCYLQGPVRYSVHINFLLGADGGDQVIQGCNFYAATRDSIAGIHLARGGGLKVVGCKFNTLSGTGYYDYGIDVDIPSGVVTGVLTITGCSIENCDNNAIRIATSGSGNYDMISITGNEIALYTAGNGGAAIDLACATTGNISEVVLTGLTMRATPGRTNAILLTNVQNVVVGDRVTEGYTNDYATAGTSSGVVDSMAGEVPSSRLISTTGLLTGGGDLSADRTLTVDTTALDERVRDTIGTSLTSGAGVTVTIDDAANTITIAAPASSGEVLMQDGVTAPPVPLETEARDDWLFEG